MELKMEVYTPGLELVGMLEIHNSVIWEEKAFSAGSFSIKSLITDETRSLLVPNNIVWIEGETAGIIEHIDQQAGDDGPYITVKGRTLTGILDWYSLWGQYDLSGSVPAIIRRLVDECCVNPLRGTAEARRIPGLFITYDPPYPGAASIRVQKTGGTLLEALEELGEAYTAAFGVRFNPQVPCMEFWVRPGADRSIHQTENDPVFYSTELDDVLSSEYTYESSGYRNVALVAGEGEGNKRTMLTVLENDVEPSWPNRRELYIDARDLQSDSDPDKPLTAEEYAAVLTNRGREKLAENQLVRSFSAEVRTYNAAYAYGEDYRLGDTITVIDERLGVTVDAVVQGAQRSVVGNDETLVLTLGYEQPTPYDILRRKADK